MNKCKLHYFRSVWKFFVFFEHEIVKRSRNLALAYNGFGLYARWRFKAQTFKQALTMIEAQVFNLPLHRHWRKTRVTGWCGLVAITFNYAGNQF